LPNYLGAFVGLMISNKF